MRNKEKAFWLLIDSTREKANGDIVRQNELLKNHLRQMSAKDIEVYQQTLSRYAREAATERLADAVRDFDPDFGADDDFDDLCHWIVSRGKQVYDKILNNPAQLSRYASRQNGRYQYYFTLFGTAYDIYEEKTGHSIPMPLTVQERSESQAGIAGIVSSDKRVVIDWCCEFESSRELFGVNSIAAEPTKALVACGGRNGIVRIWDFSGVVLSDLNVGTPAHSRDNGVQEITFESERDALVTWHDIQKRIAVWDYSTGKQLIKIDLGKHDWQKPAISEDGLLGITSHADWSLRVWNLKTGKVKFEFPEKYYAFAATPDFTSVVAHETSGKLTVWNARTGKEISSLRYKFRDPNLWLSPDGSRLLVEDGRKTEIIKIETGKKIPNDCKLRRGRFSRDGGFVASHFGTSMVSIWDVQRVKHACQIDAGGDYMVVYAFAQNNVLVTAASTGAVSVWDIEGTKLACITLSSGPFDCVEAAEGCSAVFVSDGLKLWKLSLDDIRT